MDISDEEFEKFGKPYGLSKENTSKLMQTLFDDIINSSFYFLSLSAWTIIGLNFFLTSIYNINLIELNALIPLTIFTFGINIGAIVVISFVEFQVKKLTKGAKK